MNANDHEIVLLKEKVSNLEGRVARHTSHFESERDHVKEHGQNINLLLKQTEKYSGTLYENGRGLVQRIGILEHDKKQSKSNVIMIVSIISLLISLAAVLVMIFK